MDEVETPGSSAAAATLTNVVTYALHCAQVTDEFVVSSFDATEELSRPYRLSARLVAVDEAVDTMQLLGQDAHFSITRGDHRRDFYGIVCRVTLRDGEQSRQASTIEIAPALRALGYTRCSRIFQDQSALQIVLAVLREGLGPYGREVDASQLAADRYLARDYCVQYAETNLDFVHRLLEEEGIGYYFAQTEPETVILFDANRQVPRAPTMDGGPIRYHPDLREWIGAEPMLRFWSSSRVGTTSVTVRDHDWTKGRPHLEATGPIDQPASARLPHEYEVYEHGFRRNLTIREDNELLATMLQMLQTALMPDGIPPGIEHVVHELDGAVFESFTRSDLVHQLTIRQQLLNRDATTQVGISTVTGFSPGQSFDLIGHPTLGLDGEYLLTKVCHSSEVGEDADLQAPSLNHEGANYHNRIECIPLSVSWRPERVTPKPRIYGIQTARVTGPVGMDVYTDAYGRIRVKFQWDRAETDPTGNYTCWLRVSQVWAGQGSPGFMFTPRVGMEVIVSFVDGDPDRPVVTGCVYNGENPTPGLLPIQATKSILRTRTVPHGPGHNELSFEDAMGMERVHIRAERDLDELVLNNHRTDVRQHQHNFVGADQLERIGRHQRVLVMGQREMLVEGRMSDHSGGDYLRSIAGSGTEQYGGSYELSVEGGSAITNVRSGEFVASAKGNIGLIQNGERMIKMASDGEEAGILLNSKGAVVHISENKILLKVGRSSITIEDGVIRVNQKTHPASGGGP